MGFLRNRQAIVALASLLIFAFLVLGELHFANEVTTLRKEIARLEEERTLYELQIERAASEARAYEDARLKLLKYPMRILEDEVSFYSGVESALTRNEISVADVHPVEGEKGVVAAQVNFTGSYVSVLKAITDWRQMDGVARLKFLVFLPGDGSAVRGTAVLESILKR